jgi:hypothetical protein
MGKSKMDFVKQRTVVFDNPFRRRVRQNYMRSQYFSGSDGRSAFQPFKKALLRESASWRRMLPCQPPIDYTNARRAFGPVRSELLASHNGDGPLTWRTLLGPDEGTEEKDAGPVIHTQNVMLAEDVTRIDEAVSEGFEDWDPTQPPLTLRIILQSGETDIVAIGCELNETIEEVEQKILKQKGWRNHSICFLYARQVLSSNALVAHCYYEKGTYVWARVTEKVGTI